MLDGMGGDFLDQFNLPDGAAEALKKANLVSKQVEPGVSMMSGHDHGVPYRFFTYQDFNKLKSEQLGWEAFNEEIMIQWFNDKFTRPTERVRLLVKEAPGLLSFNKLTGEPKGQYAEAYIRFKKGIQCEGMALDLWAAKYGTLSDNEIATLKANDIYTVEQFAACPEGKIRSKFPAEIVAGFERAILFVAGKEARAKAEEQLEGLQEVKKENSKLVDEVSELKAQVQSLIQLANSQQTPEKKKPGRPCKTKAEVIND